MECNRHNLSFWAICLPFYPTTDPEKNLAIRSYDVWFLRYGARQTDAFVILGHFLTFDLCNNPKNKNFEKMKKMPGYIIILHLCIINDNHMMYGS